MKLKPEWLDYGPICLILGIFGLFLFEPYPSYDELEVVKGTVEEYHWQSSGSWRGGSKYIRIWTGSDLLKFIVRTGKNAIAVDESISIKAWKKVAWELEQNGRVIYSYEQAVSEADRLTMWLKPIVFMSLIAGVFLTPLWFLNWRTRRKNINKG